MGPATAVTAAFAVVAACIAAFNLWIFLARRRERVHAWLAVAAAGIVLLAASTARLYEAQSLEQAQAIQLVQLSAAIPVVLGFLRFSSHFLRADLRRFEWLSAGFTFLAVLTMWARPDWMFSGEVRAAWVAFAHQPYVEARLAPPAQTLFPGFLAVFGWLIVVYWKHRERIEQNRRAVLAAVVFWFACGANDMAISTEVYHGPYLMSVGYVAFVLVFTAILVRRFVVSMEKVEASAETLQAVVEARTQELREKDLAIAHGERMATLGTLAAGVAHEINNPIAFISANLNQLEDTLKTPEARGQFEEILSETREGVERIRGIVRELLILARRGEGVSERVDLARVVQSVLPIMRHEAHGRAQIQTRLEPVPAVMGDERLLGQVILNLVLNGLHAIPEGAPERHAVTITAHFREGSVWLVVRDTGSGIPEEIRSRIFDPFFTTKEVGKGTGLGLAVTHQLVMRHRGRIDVESGPAGTTVTVELPPADSLAAPAPDVC